MKYAYSLLFACLLFIATSCLPELPAANPSDSYAVSEFSMDFEAFWNGMNSNYAFWDVDPTNWDAVYRKYKPLFAQLENTEEGSAKAYDYYKEMTAQLIDSHYILYFQDELAARGLEPISPAGSRYAKRPGAHNPIPDTHYTRTVAGTYLNPATRIGYPADSSKVMTMIAGTIRNTNILYFRIPEFNLRKSYEAGTVSQKATLQYVLDQLSQSTISGLIIDVRGNQGGDVPDLNFLVGRLVDKPYAYGQYRAKEGAGRLDYLPWVESTVFPPAGSKAFTKPVVVLADMISISMAEATAMAVRALPGGNGRVVGERTFGAMAPLGPGSSFYNAGAFSTPFIKKVSTAVMMFRYKDGVVYEGLGFPPDVAAPYDAAALKAGKDTQLEIAIAQIR